MALFVHVTERCEAEAARAGGEEDLETLKNKVERAQDLHGFDHFLPPYRQKKKFPRYNARLIAVPACGGGELVSLHLLEAPKLDHPDTDYVGRQSRPRIENVSCSNDTVWIDKAQSVRFRGVPENVWNFHIGGYPVSGKWLKDRKGRTLTNEDIIHYHKIAVALSETIRLMEEIDEVINQHGSSLLK